MRSHLEGPKCSRLVDNLSISGLRGSSDPDAPGYDDDGGTDSDSGENVQADGDIGRGLVVFGDGVLLGEDGESLALIVDSVHVGGLRRGNMRIESVRGLRDGSASRVSGAKQLCFYSECVYEWAGRVVADVEGDREGVRDNFRSGAADSNDALFSLE